MVLGLRYLLISLFFGLLPLAAQAQGFLQDPPLSQRPSINQGPTAVVPPAQTGTGVVPPSIGNATLQRQQSTGRPGGQIIDSRTGQLIDSRTQQPLQPEIQ